LQWVEIEALRNKTLLLDEMNETTAAALRSVGVYNVWYAQPQLAPEHGSLPLAVMEAIIMLRREHEDPLCEDDIVNFILKHDIKADLHPLYPERREPLRKYAFVVHPLSQRDLFRHPILKHLTFLPDSWNKKIEHWLARAPGMVYGEVQGVQSEANGVQAHGLLYTLFATPREMLEAKPEDIYARLVTICEDAQKKGVSIIGLGAFTKIVGDAGLTVAKRSPVPVTTGNSLSAAATLWAARDTCARLGFITFDRAKHQKVSARAMVIGATGSIGKVCAKIVSQVFDHVVLAATNGARLMDLRQDLLDMCPETHIEITTQPDRHAGACDLIIIATSATEGGVLDIDAIKPGCVVCDVSRPLTFTAQEAMRRPDVLIIESGEIELPGQVEINCDIGLEKSVVYACLAETALLALEGRFESYTLSRNINHKKVIEIYKIAKKHGAQLAAIRSPNGVVTQQEIDLCREHAEKALKTWRSRESKDRVLLPAELHAGQ
jgi:predicted amino acid dehydrogenase